VTARLRAQRAVGILARQNSGRWQQEADDVRSDAQFAEHVIARIREVVRASVVLREAGRCGSEEQGRGERRSPASKHVGEVHQAAQRAEHAVV